MKPITEFTKDYFAGLSNKPVQLKQFGPKMKLIAREYIKQMTADLEGFNVEVKTLGSTAYGIAGKGSIEIGIFVKGHDWHDIIYKLEQLYTPMEVLEKDFAEFHEDYEGYSIKIMILKGYAARVNKKIYDFFMHHPEILKRYEDMKKRFSYSEREYQKQKVEFLNDIIEDLPEDDDK